MGFVGDKRTVLISGVTRGLGLAMAREFAERGHIVVGCGRSKQAIQKLSGDLGAPHRFNVIDVANDKEVEGWAKDVFAAKMTPDLLLNNAAIINRNAPLWKVPAHEFSSVIDVNIKGVANVIRHFVPPMIKTGRGIIVNFSSGWGRSADAEVAPYCATKWAIEGMTAALAQELPNGLAAVSLNPGVINTEMLQSCFGSSASAYVTPEGWARTAVPFLLDLDGSQNGQQLTAP
jgi:NAD(P)-dependent dehydrogenase (short-subunit alcohol dehydrogenase family)